MFALQNLKKAFSNIYKSLKPGGIAVLQFGHKDSMKKHWDVIYEVFNEEPFKQYMHKINIPLYYLSLEQIYDSVLKAGFTKENTNIHSFTQDLTEDTPAAITNLHRAVSQHGYSQVFNPTLLEAFYKSMEEKLNDKDMNSYRKNQWHRTLIKLKKVE